MKSNGKMKMKRRGIKEERRRKGSSGRGDKATQQEGSNEAEEGEDEEKRG